MFNFPQFGVDRLAQWLMDDFLSSFCLFLVSRLTSFLFPLLPPFFPSSPSRQLEAEPLNGDNWGESGRPLSDQSSHTTISRLFLGPGDTTTS